MIQNISLISSSASSFQYEQGLRKRNKRARINRPLHRYILHRPDWQVLYWDICCIKTHLLEVFIHGRHTYGTVAHNTHIIFDPHEVDLMRLFSGYVDGKECVLIITNNKGKQINKNCLFTSS